MEVTGNDRFSNCFNVRTLKCKEFLKLLRDTDIPPACDIVCAITDKAGCQREGKIGTAQRLKNNKYCKGNNVVLGELGTKRESRTLDASVAVQWYGLEVKSMVFCFCSGSKVINAQRDT